jgi:hypothetical protein
LPVPPGGTTFDDQDEWTFTAGAHDAVLMKFDVRSQSGHHASVAARTAEEAVYELLGQPSRPRALVHTGARNAPEPFHGRPWTADLDTLDFLKQREILGRRLFVVAFEAEHVRHGFLPMTMLVRVDRYGQTWRARRITGASSTGELPPTIPSVNLGGTWGKLGFCGGGKVNPAGADVARVRVRFGNGVELDDSTDSGWVLFFTNRPVKRPNAEVELLDQNDAVLSSFHWPWSPDLADELRRRIRHA